MDSIAERKLLFVHDNISRSKALTFSLKVIFGVFLLCLIPYLHVGIFSAYVWPPKPPVDHTKCQCGCFDTIFRGYYENPPGSYKHWYFNATFTAYKIWCLIIVGVVIAYESFKRIASVILEKDYRLSMVIIFSLTVFPHYYGWWNYMNYYNEQFFDQWYHQLYFTVTELISSGVVLYLCRKSIKPQTYHILGIFSINLSHIIIGGFDQFFENIVYRNGTRAQVFRDLGLVIPDIGAVIVICYEVVCLARKQRIKIVSLFYKEELAVSGILTFVMVFIGKNIYF